VTDDELVELERRFWFAGGDPDFYADATTDDVVMVFPAPYGILDRERIVAEVADGSEWSEVDIEQARVVRPAPRAALVAYKASARGARGGEYVCFASSLYVEDDGEWRLAYHQQTPFEDDE
jgi:hypothetical protein